MPQLNRTRGEFRITFAGLGEAVARAGESVLDCARREGVRLAGACGGRGACGSCLVRVLSGEAQIPLTDASLPAPSEADASLPAPCEENRGWFRACLVKPQSDLVVEVSERAAATASGGALPGLEEEPPFACDSLVKSHEVRLDPPRKIEEFPDRHRLYEEMCGVMQPEADPQALQAMPQMLRDHGCRLSAHLRMGELIGFTAPGKRALGLAVDLGTTNLAGSLTDLESGERLAGMGTENPQVAYGADLISRLNHAIRTPTGGPELQSAVAKTIQALAVALCNQVSADPAQIADIVIAGNTAMHHLLLGLPVSQLASAPFTAARCGATDRKARDLGLEVMSGACVHLLPNIGGFVGGDHVAALLATEHLWESGASALIDIGTNTEISLIHRGTISTASTASGPALEGGNISCGMRAADGAIDKVWLHEGEIRTRVIGGGQALGLCGSGVLDALSALRRAGIVNGRGYISPGDARVEAREGMRAFALAPGVGLTQDDVRAVLLAKAAIRAGLDLLLEEAGLKEEMLERVLIAGAFGAYLDLASAIDLGLFPALPLERFRQIGNAAGVGVRMALASADLRARAALLAKRCRHMELNRLPGFQKSFIGRIAI